MSLGCSKNQVDSEIMMGNLHDHGYRHTQKIESAELIIVNTCGFVEASKEESIQSILEASEYKEKGQCETLAVVGCLSQRYKTELKTLIPEIDFISGTSDFHQIAQLLEKKEEIYFGDPKNNGKPQFIRDHQIERVLSQAPYSNYVKISEGCVKMCSFCIIPYLRGPLKSRPIEDIIHEINFLSSKGIKEINLVAQDLTDYGRDLSFKKRLIDVLKAIEEIPNAPWIRLLYCYPENFTEDLIDFLSVSKVILPYIDIPFQHANNRILKLMNRRTNQQDMKNLISKLRSKIPNISLRTTFIVGFPSETEEEFNELIAFIKEIQFDHIGVFTYSHEQGTKAYLLNDDIDEKIKNKRKKELLKIQAPISKLKLKQYKGKTLSVLIEGTHPETDLVIVGRTQFQAPEIDGQVLITQGEVQKGTIQKIKINQVTHYDLVGEVVF